LTHTVLTFADAQGDDEENSLTHLEHGFSSKLPPGILPHGLPTVKEVAPAMTPQEQKKEEVKEGEVLLRSLRRFFGLRILVFPVKELSEEQKQMIILSEDFQRFVLKAGKVMERALSETIDIYTDYIGGGDADEGS
jgi:dynein intermediate chain, cytosolic